jgi:hypothetical protein
MDPVITAASVGQDVPEEVLGDDDVELGRGAHELHGRVVHVHVGKFHVRIVPGLVNDHLAPQLGDLEHIGLVHGAQFLFALPGGLEAHPGDAADLGLGIDHGVQGHALAATRLLARGWPK